MQERSREWLTQSVRIIQISDLACLEYQDPLIALSWASSDPLCHHTCCGWVQLRGKVDRVSASNSRPQATASRSSHFDLAEDEEARSRRHLVRVDGFLTLSAVCGGGADDEDDCVCIEGSEHVDGEEAIQVRSFCGSFVQVCLDAQAKNTTSSTQQQ